MLEAGKPSWGALLPQHRSAGCWGPQSSQACFCREGGASGREGPGCLGSPDSHPGLLSPRPHSSPKRGFPPPHTSRFLSSSVGSCLVRGAQTEACHLRMPFCCPLVATAQAPRASFFCFLFARQPQPVWNKHSSGLLWASCLDPLGLEFPAWLQAQPVQQRSLPFSVSSPSTTLDSGLPSTRISRANAHDVVTAGVWAQQCQEEHTRRCRSRGSGPQQAM